MCSIEYKEFSYVSVKSDCFKKLKGLALVYSIWVWTYRLKLYQNSKYIFRFICKLHAICQKGHIFQRLVYYYIVIKSTKQNFKLQDTFRKHRSPFLSSSSSLLLGMVGDWEKLRLHVSYSWEKFQETEVIMTIRGGYNNCWWAISNGFFARFVR